MSVEDLSSLSVALQNLVRNTKPQVISDLVNPLEMKRLTDDMLNDVQASIIKREKGARRASLTGAGAEGAIDNVLQKINNFYDTFSTVNVQKSMVSSSMANLGVGLRKARSNAGLPGRGFGVRMRGAIGSRSNISASGFRSHEAISPQDGVDQITAEIQRIEATLKKYGQGSKHSLTTPEAPLINVECPEIEIIVEAPLITVTQDYGIRKDPKPGVCAFAPTKAVVKTQAKATLIENVISGDRSLISSDLTAPNERETECDDEHGMSNKKANKRPSWAQITIPILPDLMLLNNRLPAFNGGILDPTSRRMSVVRGLEAAGPIVTAVPAMPFGTHLNRESECTKGQIDEDLVEQNDSDSLQQEQAVQAYIEVRNKFMKGGKKRRQTVIRQQILDSFITRFDDEIPRSIYLVLLRDAYPLLRNTLQRYRLELGEKHPYTNHFLTHLRKFDNVLTSVDIGESKSDNRRLSHMMTASETWGSRRLSSFADGGRQSLTTELTIATNGSLEKKYPAVKGSSFLDPWAFAKSVSKAASMVLTFQGEETNVLSDNSLKKIDGPRRNSILPRGASFSDSLHKSDLQVDKSRAIFSNGLACISIGVTTLLNPAVSMREIVPTAPSQPPGIAGDNSPALVREASHALFDFVRDSPSMMIQDPTFPLPRRRGTILALATSSNILPTANRDTAAQKEFKVAFG